MSAIPLRVDERGEHSARSARSGSTMRIGAGAQTRPEDFAEEMEFLPAVSAGNDLSRRLLHLSCNRWLWSAFAEVRPDCRNLLIPCPAVEPVAGELFITSYARPGHVEANHP